MTGESFDGKQIKASLWSKLLGMENKIVIDRVAVRSQKPWSMGVCSDVPHADVPYRCPTPIMLLQFLGQLWDD
ncbi:hypothetical protein ACO22_06066, partial [Paracoccidioides brasiliensis]